MATEAVSSTTAPLTTEQAAAAIVQLINARPDSPRHDEIEAIVGRAAGAPTLATASLSEQQARLHEAIQECVAAEKALNATDLPADQYEAADARFTDALRRVGKLSERLPSPTRSITDIILLAQAAYCTMEKGEDGIDVDDSVEAAAARLIEAVLRFAGVNFH
jgi:hypothetical protein